MRLSPTLIAITSVGMLILGALLFYFVMTKTFVDFYSHPNPEDRSSAVRGLYHLVLPFILTSAGTVLTYYVVNVAGYLRKWHFLLVILAGALLAIASFPFGVLVAIMIAAPCLTKRKLYWVAPTSTAE